MIYVENIYLCLSPPILIAFFLLRGEVRRFSGFFLVGLTVCLLSSYINSFLCGVSGMTPDEAIVKLTPLCEEILKALPVFMYAAVWSWKPEQITTSAMATGLGFATFENVFYISQYGADNLFFALVRGVSAGIMHAVCAAILGYGLVLVSRHRAFVFSGSLGLLCLSSVFHATYNLLAAADGAWRISGFFLPVLGAVALLPLVRRPLFDPGKPAAKESP